jgi:hypothetical protein
LISDISNLGIVYDTPDGCTIVLALGLYFSKHQADYDAMLSDMQDLLNLDQLRICRTDGEKALQHACKKAFGCTIVECYWHRLVTQLQYMPNKPKIRTSDDPRVISPCVDEKLKEFKKLEDVPGFSDFFSLLVEYANTAEEVELSIHAFKNWIATLDNKDLPDRASRFIADTDVG